VYKTGSDDGNSSIAEEYSGHSELVPRVSMVTIYIPVYKEDLRGTCPRKGFLLRVFEYRKERIP
jgi:hypothetical protein